MRVKTLVHSSGCCRDEFKPAPTRPTRHVQSGCRPPAITQGNVAQTTISALVSRCFRAAILTALHTSRTCPNSVILDVFTVTSVSQPPPQHRALNRLIPLALPSWEGFMNWKVSGTTSRVLPKSFASGKPTFLHCQILAPAEAGRASLACWKSCIARIHASRNLGHPKAELF
jgi:hypothetical protein